MKFFDKKKKKFAELEGYQFNNINERKEKNIKEVKEIKNENLSVPKIFTSSLEEIVFDAFVGGYMSPSSYYLITKNQDEYFIKYGFSHDGHILDKNRNKNFKIIKKTEKEVNYFLEMVKGKTNNWHPRYNDSKIMDGTQWHLIIPSINIKIWGSNEFPDNWKDTIQYIDYFFKDVSEKKPIATNTVPEVPLMKTLAPEKMKEKQSIRLKIEANGKKYMMLFYSTVKSSYVAFLKENTTTITRDDFEPILPSEFKKLEGTVINYVNGWKDLYKGESETKWSLLLDTNRMHKVIHGEGDFPVNWNSFLDVFIEYELLFKQKKLEKESKEETFVELDY